MNARLWSVLVGVLAVPLPSLAQAGGGDSGGFGVGKGTVFWVSFAIMTAMIAASLVFVASALLRNPSWNLGDAVSEESSVQTGGVRPTMVASSSRLIALLGLLMIMGAFVGFAYYFLYSAFAGQMDRDQMKSVFYYLASGAVMFAPYLANQMQSAFSAFGIAGSPAAQPSPAGQQREADAPVG
jgi:hypothetical protein